MWIPKSTVRGFAELFVVSDCALQGDEKRKTRYLERHAKREDWTDPHTAGFWSRWLLWNEPTIAGSIADIKRRFDLKIVAA